MTIAFFIFLAIAFLIGSIPSGLILGLLTGRGDVRKVGSGNIGATNVLRAFGKRMGCLTLGLDVFKGILPVVFVIFLGNRMLGLMINDNVAPSLVALAVVLGHVYTPWLRFKGGKGVATALGAAIGFSPFSILPFSILPSITLFVFAIATTRYVSLGSILGALALPMYWLYRMIVFPRVDSVYVLLIWTLLSAIIILRHRKNIVGLINGKEHKLGKKG
ncbi:MAG: glycerol-3-phosphate 1-O-acyltransferase PlsY [Holophagaceae bacterium]|nr:glycerol-3-phosphate 1-O-acyltransferase PlsY [Holophagaceae bacterium]